MKTVLPTCTTLKINCILIEWQTHLTILIRPEFNQFQCKLLTPHHFYRTLRTVTFNMAPKLYMIPYSQPVRATLMTIKALNIDVELKEVNLLDKQQHSPEYLKLNPQHSVPTLDDDGFVIWDSHVIMQYLVEKYSPGNPLYPTDIKKKAIINQRLHFESGVLFPRTMAIIRPIIYEGVKTIPNDKKEAVVDAYGLLEKFLDGNQWVAGDELTIADFSVMASISAMNLVVPIDSNQFPNVTRWLKKVEDLPYNETSKVGLKQMEDVIRSKCL